MPRAPPARLDERAHLDRRRAERVAVQVLLINKLVAPRVVVALGAARRRLPLVHRRQALALPVRVRIRVPPGHARHRQPRPVQLGDVGVVPSVHVVRRLAAVLPLFPATPRPVARGVGLADRLEERIELGVGHLVQVDLKVIQRHRPRVDVQVVRKPDHVFIARRHQVHQVQHRLVVGDADVHLTAGQQHHVVLGLDHRPAAAAPARHRYPHPRRPPTRAPPRAGRSTPASS